MTHPTKKLGEVATLITGGTPSKTHPEYFGGEIKWLVSGDIHQKEIFDCEGRITEAGFKSSNARLLPLNSVMIALNGQGKTRASVAILRTKATCNQSLVAISPNEKELIPDFLWHNLNGRYLEIRALTGMDKRQGLNMQIIRNIEIPLPQIAEQKKIVARIEKQFAKIDENARLRAESLAATGQLLPAVLHEIFSSAESKGWDEKNLGEVFTFNYGKGLDRSARSESGKFMVYGANGELGKSDKHLVEGAGIIIGRKGSAGELTRVSGKYWPTDVTYYVVEDNLYDIGFAYYLFKFLNFPQYATGVKPGINRNQIYKLKIFLPSLAEQKKIVKKLDALSERVRALRELQLAQSADLKALKQSILHEAFSGAEK